MYRCIDCVSDSDLTFYSDAPRAPGDATVAAPRAPKDPLPPHGSTIIAKICSRVLPLTLKFVNVPGVPNNAQQLINVRRLYRPGEMVKAMKQKLPHLQGLPPGRLVCTRYRSTKLSETFVECVLEPDSHIVVTYERPQPRDSPPGAQSADTLVNANTIYSDKKVTQLHVNFYNGPIPIP